MIREVIGKLLASVMVGSMGCLIFWLIIDWLRDCLAPRRLYGLPKVDWPAPPAPSCRQPRGE